MPYFISPDKVPSRRKVSIPNYFLLWMIRHTFCTEACNGKISNFIRDWNTYKQGVGSVSDDKHKSVAVWCWKCGAAAHRKCISYMGRYKLIKDYYQCNQCCAATAGQLQCWCLITKKPAPDYILYVIYVYKINIETILTQY